MTFAKRVPGGTDTVRAGRRIGALVVCFLALAPAASAQTDDCEALRQQLAVASRGDAGRASQFARAAQRQQSELQRTQAYADQIGCSGSPFLNFGDEPPQCASVHAQIARMSNNLNTLETQSESYQPPDPARQVALAAQYQNECTTVPQDYGGSRYDGGLDADPAHANDDAMRRGFDDPDQEPPDQTPRPRSGGGQPICVRTCDGGFFPVSYSGAGHDLGELQALCTALCPNTEAKIYTTASTDDIGAAVSADGARYTDLASAFKYTKSFDRTCTCKPAGTSWVDALAEAEKLIDRGSNNDVTVTGENVRRYGASRLHSAGASQTQAREGQQESSVRYTSGGRERSRRRRRPGADGEHGIPPASPAIRASAKSSSDREKVR